MAVITVRNLPDSTKEQLRVKAAQSGLSLEQYVRNLLEAASNTDSNTEYNVMEAAAKYFGQQNGVDLDLPSRKSHRGNTEF